MKHIALYTVCLFLPCSTANPQEKGKLCANKHGHDEIMECLQQIYEQAEKELQRTFEQALTSIKNSDSKLLIKNYWESALRKAQGQWIKFREKDCGDPVKYENGDGASGLEASWNCMIEKTRMRREELETRYNLKRAPVKPEALPAAEEVVAPLIYTQLHIRSRIQGGPGPFYWDCPETITMTASSDVKSRAQGGHPAADLLDTNVSTAWLAETAGPGIGAWVEFEIVSLSSNKGPLTFGFQVVNGYAASDSNWTQNGRVKEMLAYFNGKVAFKVNLMNTPEFQEFFFGSVLLFNNRQYKVGDRIRFVITKVYEGSRYKKTYLSSFLPRCGI